MAGVVVGSIDSIEYWDFSIETLEFLIFEEEIDDA